MMGRLMLYAIVERISHYGWERGWHTIRVGQNQIYTVCIRYFWQGNHQIYGHIKCIYTVLANPTYYGWEG